MIQNQISKVAENFAVSLQKQYVDYTDYNKMYNPFKGFRIDIKFLWIVFKSL